MIMINRAISHGYTIFKCRCRSALKCQKKINGKKKQRDKQTEFIFFFFFLRTRYEGETEGNKAKKKERKKFECVWKLLD